MKLEIDPKAKGLIFDLDGTVVDSMPFHYIAWKDTAAKYGIDLSVELFEELAGVPIYATVEKYNEMFGMDINPKEMGDIKEKMYEENLHKVTLVEPVFDIIKKYHGKIPMAIGTGGGRDIAQKTVKHVGLDKYIDIVVSADDVNQYKPHPDTFLLCAKLMGVEPPYCQVFEDAKPGMQAAREAGMILVDVTKYYEVTTGK